MSQKSRISGTFVASVEELVERWAKNDKVTQEIEQMTLLFPKAGHLLAKAATGIALWASLGFPHTVLAETEVPTCTLVAKLGAKAPMHRSGILCDTAFSPASTFKVPLALMGFESGLLENPNSPEIPYDPAINAHFKSWRQATTPKKWLKNSVIWYSQDLTQKMGLQNFQAFVDAWDYGNRDLSGDPGKNNGLTRAWLSSSLKITPAEQLEFFSSLLEGKLPVQNASIAFLQDTLTVFEAANGLPVKGKTGLGWVTDANGKRLDAQHGWFVGWTEYNSETYIFVRIRVEAIPKPGFVSSRTRKSVLEDLPNLLKAQ